MPLRRAQGIARLSSTFVARRSKQTGARLQVWAVILLSEHAWQAGCCEQRCTQRNDWCDERALISDQRLLCCPVASQSARAAPRRTTRRCWRARPSLQSQARSPRRLIRRRRAEHAAQQQRRPAEPMHSWPAPTVRHPSPQRRRRGATPPLQPASAGRLLRSSVA